MDGKPTVHLDNKGIGVICALIKSIFCKPLYDSLRTKLQLEYETVTNIPFIKV